MFRLEVIVTLLSCITVKRLIHRVKGAKICLSVTRSNEMLYIMRYLVRLRTFPSVSSFLANFSHVPNCL